MEAEKQGKQNGRAEHAARARRRTSRAMKKIRLTKEHRDLTRKLENLGLSPLEAKGKAAKLADRRPEPRRGRLATLDA